MKNLEKILIGTVGGLLAVFAKLLSQDTIVLTSASQLTADQIMNLAIGYTILTPILIIIGAVVAWASDENKRFKLLTIAISGPALITTLAGGVKDKEYAFNPNLITSAYAMNEIEQTKTTSQETPDQLSDKKVLDRIGSGVKAFFGFDKTPKRFWVVVGSFKDKSEAIAYQNKINSQSEEIQAWVGIKSATNDYYPVIVGGYDLLPDALKTKEKALKMKLINDAYLSPGDK